MYLTTNATNLRLPVKSTTGKFEAFSAPTVVVCAKGVVKPCAVIVSRGRYLMPIYGLVKRFIISHTPDTAKMPLVDSLTRFLLLDRTKDVVLQMNKVHVRWGIVWSRWNTCHVCLQLLYYIFCARIRKLLAAVRQHLVSAINRGKVALKDVCTIGILLQYWAQSWTKSTDHVSFKAGQGMAILVALASKASLGTDAGRDWALLSSFFQLSMFVNVR